MDHASLHPLTRLARAGTARPTAVGPEMETPDRAAWQAYTDPAVQTQFVHRIAETDGNPAVEAHFILESLRCAACAQTNERHLSRQPGVHSIKVHLATRRAVVRWDPARNDLPGILRAFAAIGYDAWPAQSAQAAAVAERERRSLKARLAVAGFAMMQTMMFAWPSYFDAAQLDPAIAALLRWAGLVVTIPVLLYSAAPMLTGAWRGLRTYQLDMDTPVALGICAAFVASSWATWRGGGEVYFDSITMFVTLLLLARYLELRMRQEARSGAEELARQIPAVCTILAMPDPAAPQRILPVAALRPGDHVLVKPGETIPADGTVAAGEGAVEEALLTGENRPRIKRLGDSLLAGSHNQQQPLVLKVAAIGAATQLAGIVRLLEQALQHRPRIVQFADRVARWFTLGLLGVALVTGLIWWQLAPERAWIITLAVLVVSCPCALSLAMPAALAAAHGAMARQGLLVVRGHAIESLARVTDVIFDKTGTLTLGNFGVTGVTLSPRGQTLGLGQVVSLAAGLEAASNHPIALAMSQYARSFGAGMAAMTDLQSVAGGGWQGNYADARYRIGAYAFAQGDETPKYTTAAHEDAAHTQIWFADRQGWLARFALADTSRTEAAKLIEDLRAAGKTVHLLSGDAPVVVADWAERFGIACWRGGASPGEKQAYVQTLQKKRAVVLMVGDGVNDAPVLGQADVSIAMGQGAPVAQAGADIVLAGGAGLAAIQSALNFSHKVMRVARQNLTWAVVYNLIAIPLAATGHITPWLAALGMSTSSILVALNALRLRAMR